MLNLAPVFSDAVSALDQYAEFLTIRPLPATVYRLQRDVVNHYRYALTHYFDLTLEESFLQNSSLGSPYEKWAKFTNDDFAMLAFAFHNLLRYTSRFIHATECSALRKAEAYRQRALRSNDYTYPLCEMREKGIGIRIEPGQVLLKTAFRRRPEIEGRVSFRQEGRETIVEHTTQDAHGADQTVVLAWAEYRQLTQAARDRRYDITDRQVITSLQADGLSEVAVLLDFNRTFGELCNRFYGNARVAEEFDRLHESWEV